MTFLAARCGSAACYWAAIWPDRVFPTSASTCTISLGRLSCCRFCRRLSGSCVRGAPARKNPQERLFRRRKASERHGEDSGHHFRHRPGHYPTGPAAHAGGAVEGTAAVAGGALVGGGERSALARLARRTDVGARLAPEPVEPAGYTAKLRTVHNGVEQHAGPAADAEQRAV